MNEVTEANIVALRASGVLDEQWYLEQYPDVKLLRMDPAHHYLWVGVKLGRKPSAHSTAPLVSMPIVTPYLLVGADTRASRAGRSALDEVHNGPSEFRRPLRKPSSCHSEFQSVHSNWYLEQHPEVAGADLDPITHYVRVGAALGTQSLSMVLYQNVPSNLSGRRCCEGQSFHPLRSIRPLESRRPGPDNYAAWIATYDVLLIPIARYFVARSMSFLQSL